MFLSRIAILLASGVFSSFQIAQASSGDFRTVGCSAEMEQTIDEAMQIYLGQLHDPDWLTKCLQKEVITWENEFTIEDFIRVMREPKTTEIRCIQPDDTRCGSNQNAQGCFRFEDLGADNEIFYLIENNQNRYKWTVASETAHEVAHSKGWLHPVSQSGRQYSGAPPTIIGGCLGKISNPADAQNASRSNREIVLPKVGYRKLDYGQSLASGRRNYFELSCGSSGVIVGIESEISSTQTNFRLLCKEFDAPKSESPTASDWLFDAEPSLARIVDCSAIGSSHARGVLGNYDVSTVTGFGMLCATGKNSVDTAPAWVTGSNSGSVAFSRKCPADMALSGFRGWTISADGRRAIKELRPLCVKTDINVHSRGSLINSDIVGKTTGEAFVEHCFPGNILHKLDGLRGSSLLSLGGECKETELNRTSPVRAVLESNKTGRYHLLPSRGRIISQADQSNSDCQLGDAIIGLRVGYKTSDGLDNVRAVCANVPEWDTPGGEAATTRGDSYVGDPGGRVSTISCPRRSFVVGLRTWVSRDGENDGKVNGVGLLCQRVGEREQMFQMEPL